MPAFAAHADDPAANRLSPEELDLLVSWLRGEWYEPRSATINPPSQQSRAVGQLCSCSRQILPNRYSLARLGRRCREARLSCHSAST